MTRQLQRALAQLNPRQHEAVLHQDSPLLILAGAGSGKTRVITVKIAYLVDQLGVDPRSILAVTFTNKAAGEMRERAQRLVSGAGDITIRTFHSFGAWLLRRNADAAGLPRSFTIYDDDDVITLLKSLFPHQNRQFHRGVANSISRAKDYCFGPADDLAEISFDPELPDHYRRYQERLNEIGNVDFGDLILKPVRLLETDASIAARLRSRFRYILVDEYQDSNVAQYRLLRALADTDTFVCVVGDDDQSIYRFRGARIENILSFPDEFADTRVIRLEQNYRSTAPILDLAGAVVANNEGRLGKTLFTEREGGRKPQLLLLADQDDEVAFAVDRVRRAERAALPGVTAILYRTNAQSRPFETAFLREGISYRIIGSLRFYEREEIKDAVAFLKLLANGRDEVAFRRIINKPARGIGAKSVEKILESGALVGDLVRGAERAASDLSRKAAAAVKEFVAMIGKLGTVLGPEAAEVVVPLRRNAPPDSEQTTLADFVETVLHDSSLLEYHREQDKVSGTGKVQNLEELVNAASLYSATPSGLLEFLEAIELDSQRERGDDADAGVVLITMHNTKGLEFDRVIISGLEEGLFPRDDDPEELEEERRLFYVAVTRARDELHLTSCRYRRHHGRFTDFLPSRFLGEIPAELLEVDGAGYAVTGGGRAGSGAPSLWQRGQRVYHDEYGTGEVIKQWRSGGDECIRVRFETGRTAEFIPRYTPLERLASGEDW